MGQQLQDAAEGLALLPLPVEIDSDGYMRQGRRATRDGRVKDATCRTPASLPTHTSVRSGTGPVFTGRESLSAAGCVEGIAQAEIDSITPLHTDGYIGFLIYHFRASCPENVGRPTDRSINPANVINPLSINSSYPI